MNGDQMAKFIVEFANQVTQVNVTNKIIRFGVDSATMINTSYEDLTQPLFTNYSSSLAFVTGTLGVTVQFN